ncbi:MAG: hypothetical protein EOM14_09110 [Clostridia bacterium]|nr:hypothetical protein [Clostridia bacterium]
MALTLSRLLSNTDSFDIRCAAGQSGMNALVRWIHMVEDIEVPCFLHGNELVFTTGIAQSGNDWLTPFAKSLKEHGAICRRRGFSACFRNTRAEPEGLVIRCQQSFAGAKIYGNGDIVNGCQRDH